MNPKSVEKVEQILNGLEKKRDSFEKEITRIQEDMSHIVKSLFDQITAEINGFLSETDAIIDASVADYNRMDHRRKELDSIREKLSPVLDILQKSD